MIRISIGIDFLKNDIFVWIRIRIGIEKNVFVWIKIRIGIKILKTNIFVWIWNRIRIGIEKNIFLIEIMNGILIEKIFLFGLGLGLKQIYFLD